MPKVKKIKLSSTIVYSTKIAKRFSKTAYYKAQALDQKSYEILVAEKKRLSTARWEQVTDLLEKYTQLGSTPVAIALSLQGIYRKNQVAATKGTIEKNSNLLYLVGHPEILALAYKEIRGNKGALTKGSFMDKDSYNKLDPKQKKVYYQSFKLPDGMSPYWINLISKLIRKGKYPWGTSNRIYMDKPGQPEKKRPITIPPFVDRMVQKAIELVLQAIYEPYFEKRNRSFGFRPNKGVHDAMSAILSYQNNGARFAIEGDIEGAYDTVDKKRLLEILQKRISDRKFINFLQNRLNYDYVEKETKKRFRPEKGIPQGGIDSPYLFNIYMNELDEFVHTDLQTWVDSLNSHVTKRKLNHAWNSNRAKKKKLLRLLAKAKSELATLPRDKNNAAVQKGRRIVHHLLKQIRLVEHHKNRLSSSPNNDRIIRIFYTRYADDWIILTNADRPICLQIKDKVTQFLNDNLGLKLSEKKTLITNITKSPAKFLGFEIRNSQRGALRKKPTNTGLMKKHTLSKKSGLVVWLAPDRKRLIDRFHMKGYCDAKGYPITMPWLTQLEPHVIIDRFNSVIRGLGEFYLPQIRNKSNLHRWIYILRFSCLKTLAQKFKCSISKIFKRFGYNMHSKSDQTVRVQVNLKVNSKTFSKGWTLLTYKDLLRVVNSDIRKKKLGKTYWATERGQIGGYPLLAGRVAKITNDNYVNKISWVSWRTQAGLNMPCAHCGTTEKVQQHHISHIRKTGYVLIPEKRAYQRIMSLRNRKQIPLCFNCHRNVVHTGKYSGPSLGSLAPTKTMDNRILQVESYVHPGSTFNGKSLEEKGWKPADQ